MQTPPNLDADLRAIEAINQRDVQFSLAGDKAKMMSQWTDDFVLLPWAGPILPRARRHRGSVGGREDPEILEYVLDIQEVNVLGDYAYQWGTYHYAMRPHAGDATARTAGKLMRILQRQPDGSWKMYRGIATVDAPTR
jgi:ketosteroid isomerase-like protein